ncbi:MAG: cobalamin-binding protein [Actinobacteria bacterium]|nr:cobalamin-binding protein [Actinomycetota bacterium]
MRIVSLVPSATEFLFAMGLGPEVVGVTHECDHPDEAADLVQLTRSVIAPGLEPRAIDAAVREHTERGAALYALDEELLAECEPDLIVAQQLCEVCAVSFDDVRAMADRLPSQPAVISLDPTTVGEVLGCIRTIAQAVDDRRVLLGERPLDFGDGATDADSPADGDSGVSPGSAKDAGVDLLRSLADRIDMIKLDLRELRGQAGERQSVVALEWLDPPFVGGHWIPQMIELAGGVDLLGLPGERSRQTDWNELRAAEPDVVVLMQCGYDLATAAGEADEYTEELRSLGAARIFACDATAYFSRPGPRIVDGLEQLAHALHPALTAEPDTGRMIEIEL